MLSVLALAVLAQPAAPAMSPSLVVMMEKGGSFTISTDVKSSPQTVRRVTELVRQGFYDRQRFHRVEPWVVQWGSPASKDGDLNRPEVGGGGSGKNMAFEGSRVAFTRGVVGVASTGARVGGDSQLFILTRDATHLNGNYAVLGRVAEGMAVVDKIQRGDRITSIKITLPTPQGKRRQAPGTPRR